MGRIDRFVAQELPRIKEREKSQKELEESYTGRAGRLMTFLNGYVAFNGAGEDSPLWLQFFRSYLGRIASSPRIVSYVDDFVLKQLESLIDSCGFWGHFLAGMWKFSGWTLLYFPLLFFLAVYLLSGGHTTLFWWVSGIGLFISLIDDFGRKVLIHHLILLIAAFVSVRYFSFSLETSGRDAFLLIEIYGIIVNIVWARRFALARCASSAFPISYLTVEEVVGKLNSGSSST